MYGIGQLPADWLADRIGPRILVTTGICDVTLAGLLVDLSQSYIMMVFFLVLMGVLGGRLPSSLTTTDLGIGTNQKTEGGHLGSI